MGTDQKFVKSKVLINESNQMKTIDPEPGFVYKDIHNNMIPVPVTLSPHEGKLVLCFMK